MNVYFVTECSAEDVNKDEKASEEEKKAEPTPMVSYKDLVRNVFIYLLKNNPSV
jgi:hypothetical protein